VSDFYIEMLRFGAYHEVLVTLRDAKGRPKLGSYVQDESGASWKVCDHTASEVELEPPPNHPEDFPTGTRLTGEASAAVAISSPHHPRKKRKPSGAHRVAQDPGVDERLDVHDGPPLRRRVQ